MEYQGVPFLEAVRWLADQSNVIVGPRPGQSRAPKPSTRELSRPERKPPSGLPLADALALVKDSERRLWTREGATALQYLRSRGLEDHTIRAARLGWTSAPRAWRGSPPGWSFRGLTAIGWHWSRSDRPISGASGSRKRSDRPNISRGSRTVRRFFQALPRPDPGKPVATTEGGARRPADGPRACRPRRVGNHVRFRIRSTRSVHLGPPLDYARVVPGTGRRPGRRQEQASWPAPAQASQAASPSQGLDRIPSSRFQ